MAFPYLQTIHISDCFCYNEDNLRVHTRIQCLFYRACYTKITYFGL